MTAESPPDRGAVLAPVVPAGIVRLLVRPLTKILNPLMISSPAAGSSPWHRSITLAGAPGRPT